MLDTEANEMINNRAAKQALIRFIQYPCVQTLKDITAALYTRPLCCAIPHPLYKLTSSRPPRVLIMSSLPMTTACKRCPLSSGFVSMDGTKHANSICYLTTHGGNRRRLWREYSGQILLHITMFASALDFLNDKEDA